MSKEDKIYESRRKFALESVTNPTKLSHRVHNQYDEISGGNDRVIAATREIEDLCFKMRDQSDIITGSAAAVRSEYKTARDGFTWDKEKPLASMDVFQNAVKYIREHENNAFGEAEEFDRLLRNLEQLVSELYHVKSKMWRSYRGLASNAAYVERVARTYHEWGYLQSSGRSSADIQGRKRCSMTAHRLPRPTRRRPSSA